MTHYIREMYKGVNRSLKCLGAVMKGIRDYNNNILTNPVDILNKF